MKNISKISRRGILGILSISLVVVSASALFIFSQTLPALSITNPSGLASLCVQPLITGTTVNNGTTGSHESFTTAFSCTSPIASPFSPTATTQSVLSVVTSGSYKPTFTVDTSGSTATVTSTSLTLNTNSIQSGATWCTSGNPSYVLVSGTATALSSSIICQNGSSTNSINVYWYTLVVVASTFGTVSTGQVVITWSV